MGGIRFHGDAGETHRLESATVFCVNAKSDARTANHAVAEIAVAEIAVALGSQLQRGVVAQRDTIRDGYVLAPPVPEGRAGRWS